MVLAVDDHRIYALIDRISVMSRKYESICERFSCLSQHIDMELQSEESIRRALRNLENEMNRVHAQINMMREVLEEILSEYQYVYRQCKRDVDELESDLDVVSMTYTTGAQKYSLVSSGSRNELYQAYIRQLNSEIAEPVGYTQLLKPELRSILGIEVEETDIEGNIQVEAWRKPEFL